MPVEDELQEIEVLDGELVLSAPAPIEREPVGRLPVRAPQPAMVTAVAAATGFVAGAATMALLRRYGLSRLERAAEAPVLAPRPSIQSQARTYVVHVRQLG